MRYGSGMLYPAHNIIWLSTLSAELLEEASKGKKCCGVKEQTMRWGEVAKAPGKPNCHKDYLLTGAASTHPLSIVLQPIVIQPQTQ